MFGYNKNIISLLLVLTGCFGAGIVSAAQRQLPNIDAIFDNPSNFHITQNSATTLTASSEPQNATLTAEQKKAELMQKVLLKIYHSNLLKKTYKHVVYPESSIELNEEGEVILIVQVDRSGDVLGVEYESKSSSIALNRAAKNAVKMAKPFSSPPDALDGEQFDIRMPIRFRLTN